MRLKKRIFETVLSLGSDPGFADARACAFCAAHTDCRATEIRRERSALFWRFHAALAKRCPDYSLPK